LTAEQLVPKMLSMRAHFGPFDVDTDNGRLLKHGIAVRLREQPFRVLVALLERPGDVVTRDELRRRLWSDRTFVDFEVGLNSAVSRLRHALDDPADSPRLIETVPKRGYRFIGSVPRQPSLAVMAGNGFCRTRAVPWIDQGVSRVRSRAQSGDIQGPRTPSGTRRRRARFSAACRRLALSGPFHDYGEAPRAR